MKHKADLWPKYLTGVAAAHNNTVSATLGYSPFYLQYMRHPVSPDSFNLEPIEGPSPMVEQYVGTEVLVDGDEATCWNIPPARGDITCNPSVNILFHTFSVTRSISNITQTIC